MDLRRRSRPRRVSIEMPSLALSDGTVPDSRPGRRQPRGRRPSGRYRPLQGLSLVGNAAQSLGRMVGDDGGCASLAATAASTMATEQGRGQRNWVCGRHGRSSASPSSSTDARSGRLNGHRRHACRSAVPLGQTLTGLERTAPEAARRLGEMRAWSRRSVMVGSFETGPEGNAHEGRQHTRPVHPSPLDGD